MEERERQLDPDAEVESGESERELGSVFGLIVLFGVIGAFLALLLAFVPTQYSVFFAGLATLLFIGVGLYYLLRGRRRLRRRV